MISREEYLNRAERVLALVADQVRSLQKEFDAAFADSAMLEYDLNRLAVEFGVPVRCLLHAFTEALRTDRLPPTCRICSDHRIRVLLRPSLDEPPEPQSSPQPEPEASHAPVL